MVTIGSDPEAFIFDNQKQKIVSVENLIKQDGSGTKENPLDIGRGCNIQEDNALVEWNTKPVKTLKEWLKIQNYSMDYINMVLGDKYQIDLSSSAYLDWNDLLTEQCIEAGCEPDYNAWNELSNNAPDLTNSNLRSAGGHIHIGIDADIDQLLNLVKVMDKYLGIPSLKMDPDNERREIYGKAGCFRIKEYGVEYRTLSNFWLQSEELMTWAFNQTMRAVENINEYVDYEVEDIINKNQVEKCVEYSVI